jgi:hypothetical protein
MNAEIRQQGVRIKMVPITADRARIGSGESCEIQLKDPFVAQLVAELVRDGDGWRIVDAGTSIDGVTHNGTRVLDERVIAGESYTVGAFELIIDPEQAMRAAQAASAQAGGAIPMTMMSADLGVIPGTMIRPAEAAPARPQANSKLVFAPVAAEPRAVPQRRTAAPATPSSTRRRVLLVAAVALATICISLAVLVSSAPKQARGGAKDSTTATQQQTAPPSAPVASVSGDVLASNLEIDKAFAAWEAEFATKPSPELRDKIVRGAFELARAHAAAGDSVAASRHFARVVRYGDPNSEAVRIARARVPQQ